MGKKSFPDDVKKAIAGRKGSDRPMYVDVLKEDWTFDDLKDANESCMLKKVGSDMQLKENPVKYVLFPNFTGLVRVMTSGSKKEVDFLQCTKGTRVVFYHYNELGRRDIKTKVMVSDDLYSYVVMHEGNVMEMFSRDRLEEGALYWVRALDVEFAVTISSENLVMHRLVAFSCKMHHEDFSLVKKRQLPSLAALNLVWDFENGIALFDNIELFIILSALAFNKESYPAINLIICGESGTRKTAWFDMFRTVFGDNYVTSRWATIKGLMISFYGDKISAGTLFRASYVAMIDEFFRKFLVAREVSRMGKIDTVIEGLSDFMNVLEHKEMEYPSGKGSVVLRMKSSFLATDNLIYRDSIPSVWRKDPAVLRRLSWLLVSDMTRDRCRMAKNYDSDFAARESSKMLKKHFKSFGEYAKFFRYARDEMRRMDLDRKDIAYLQGLLDQVKLKYHDTFFVETPVRSLYICYKFFARHVVLMPKFEEIFWRLVDDARKVLVPEWQETRGGDVFDNSL